MWLDVVVLILLLLALLKGLRNGLIIALFSLVAFVLGLAAAIKLSAIVAAYMGTSVNVPAKWLPVLAFLSVFIIVALLVKLVARIIEQVVAVSMLGWANKLGGVVFYVLIYLFVFSILLFYASQLHIVKPDTVQASVTYPYLQPLGPKMVEGIGTILPFFKNMFSGLLQFFQTVAGKTTGVHYGFLPTFGYSNTI